MDAVKENAVIAKPREWITQVKEGWRNVVAEMQKVTWPSRRETAITTAMVFVMVAIASVFFLVADQIIRIFITFVLGLGS